MNTDEILAACERIRQQWDEHDCYRRYVVVDDLPLTCPHFVQTDKTIGLTRADAASIASYFGVTLYPFPTER